jgi:hypothetical protein
MDQLRPGLAVVLEPAMLAAVDLDQLDLNSYFGVTMYGPSPDCKHHL